MLAHARAVVASSRCRRSVVDRHPRDRRPLRPARRSSATTTASCSCTATDTAVLDRGLAQQAHPAAADRPPRRRQSFVVDAVGARAHQAGAAQARLAGRRPRRLHAGHAAPDRPRRDRLARCAPYQQQGRRQLLRGRLGRRRAPLRRRQDARRRRRDGRRRRRPRSSSSRTPSAPGSGATSCSSAPPSPPRRSASTPGR